MDSSIDVDGSTHTGQFPVCRTIGCEQAAEHQDEFCLKCREEIDAVRAEARSEFVIWGTSGSSGRGTESPRAMRAWRQRPRWRPTLDRS